MTDLETTALEARLAEMTDAEVLAYYQTLEVDAPEVDVVCGELERRQLDV